MKLPLILFTGLFLFSSKFSAAQYARFPTSGVIEYEKSVNMYALLQNRINKNNEGFMRQALESYKKSQPQFKKLKSTLSFSGNRTLFTPIEETASGGGFFDDPMVTQHNTIFTDLGAGTSITRKNVFEETFLVKDSTRKINWKITSQTREIAGYACRRANALVMDSIYVVAFYTDQIPVSGGPESFTGLPGMILGLALPHENITWFATKVTDQTVTANTMTPPSKGKTVDNKGLRTTLETALKRWGDYAQAAMKAFLL